MLHVNVGIYNLSLTDTSDYSAEPVSLQGVISSADGNSPVCVTVSIVDDDILEEDNEMFSARLTSTNAGVGWMNSIDVSITDNDGSTICMISLICTQTLHACVPLNVRSQYVYIHKAYICSP